MSQEVWEKYKIFVQEGIGKESPLKKVQSQLIFGNGKFVTKAMSRLPKAKQKDLSEISKKRWPKVYAP